MIDIGKIKPEIGFLGCIHRGVPPTNCAMGCPEFLSQEICATCYRRPIKEVDVTYKGLHVYRAVMQGLVSMDEVREFTKNMIGES